MSRLTDLIAKAKAKDPQLGADLDREIKILSSRLPFGLNFERHSPEVVELPLRPVRKGDKVRILPERGSPKKGDQRLWQVKAIHKAKKTADLELLGAADVETQTVALSDLVVIAEFRDTIWPGLVSTGKVQRGGDKPFHSVINGENYHVLKALTYTHRGKVDVIYIDPPYNSGAKDWKYNNDYVEGDDIYRHSKWLAMMERRLLVAKELLNPSNSVLIATIDEKEYLRLGLLLEQTFPEARIQMATSLINPKGVARGQELYRVDEYIFFVYFGSASVTKTNDPMILTGKRNDTDQSEEEAEIKTVRWGNLLRSGTDAKRSDRKNQFYPIFLNAKTGKLHSVGEPLLPETAIRDEIIPPEGTLAVWPIRKDGSEGRWQVGNKRLRYLFDGGFASIGRFNGSNRVSFSYVTDNVLDLIESGKVAITGRDGDGVVTLVYSENAEISDNPKTMWNKTSHSASEYGSTLLRHIIPARKFPFPKSLYAVEDTLRFFIANNPEAIILDFFSGSGTTAHAVMRLNKQDGGRRQCISVTNNEVAADEQKQLREQGFRPGDPEWEKWGICDYITKPRVQAAITGKTPDGEPIKGNYKFIDEFPMSEGFEENAEFFTLTYEAEKSVSHNLAYARIATLLWLRAGARGKRIDKLPAEGWAVTDAYGLLSVVDQATPFTEAIIHASDVRVAFIVTDDDRHFQSVARRLPKGVDPVRLYESYLTNFSFTSGELTE
ncbi:site-specific DNA-methyltransferase [Pectobacterium parmentieri]|uniref:site-specific DNA-methyltransferase (adenine-specific) n=1 Tax=Pectobacterium parmentieri TaxID=1905730 RepID=A0A8B3F0T7_PECPM|nr:MULTISPECIES: DNA methyltransferase [Pectobacterium]AYH20408.1 site-specific DNA-methyltransferase [Pectobacterium parmentieri]RKO73850.1 site-specific DNA-methyltransferase [Pectobacterium parmentieri]